MRSPEEIARAKNIMRYMGESPTLPQTKIIADMVANVLDWVAGGDGNAFAVLLNDLERLQALANRVRAAMVAESN